jgi:hypothetical protein
MNLTKVKLIAINIYPTIQPYIRENDLFIDKKSGQYFRCECDHNNKKILLVYQPIRFSIVDEEEVELLSHEQIVTSKINYELLDELIDEVGMISTKHKLTSFDVSLCELILMNNGECWIEETEKGIVIHLQNSKPITRKQLMKQMPK